MGAHGRSWARMGDRLRVPTYEHVPRTGATGHHWSPVSAHVRPLKPEPPGTFWHPLVPMGAHGRSWAHMGDCWRVPTYECVPRTGATGHHWLPVSARVRPLKPEPPGTFWHPLVPMGAHGRSWARMGDCWRVPTYECVPRTGATGHHWSPVSARVRPLKPEPPGTFWHPLVLMGAHGRSWERMGDCWRVPTYECVPRTAPLVTTGCQ